MSAKQRFLHDKSGAVMAEWVVIGSVAFTLFMVVFTAVNGSAAMAATGL